MPQVITEWPGLATIRQKLRLARHKQLTAADRDFVDSRIKSCCAANLEHCPDQELCWHLNNKLSEYLPIKKEYQAAKPLKDDPGAWMRATLHLDRITREQFY